MKIDLAPLHELLAKMQNLRESQQEQIQNMRRRLNWLEQQRRELFNTLATETNDQQVRHKLDSIEQQSAELQSLLGDAERDLAQSLRDIRQRIMNLRNEKLTAMEDHLKQVRARREQLHSRLLPEAQARVSALQEEEDRLTQQCNEISRRIQALNRFDTDTTEVA